MTRVNSRLLISGKCIRIILRDIGNTRAMLEALKAYGIDPVIIKGTKTAIPDWNYLPVPPRTVGWWHIHPNIGYPEEFSSGDVDISNDITHRVEKENPGYWGAPRGDYEFGPGKGQRIIKHRGAFISGK